MSPGQQENIVTEEDIFTDFNEPTRCIY